MNLRALDFDAVSNLAVPSVILRDSPLRPVADAFYRNVDRLRSMASLPPYLIGLTRSVERSAAHAFQRGDPNHFGEAYFKAQQLNSTDAIDEGLGSLGLWHTQIPFMHAALESLLSATIVGLWTAVETLAGDLWEAALNLHPHTLADLAGKPANRITKRSFGHTDFGSHQAAAEGEGKQLSLREMRRITSGSYDLSRLMGTALKTKFRFTSLDGIREAYSVAFSEQHTGIDQALSHECFDVLSAFRNVIVHSGGVADREFAKATPRLQNTTLLADTALAPLGQRVELTGPILKAIFESTVTASNVLLTAVATWIEQWP